MKKNIKNLIILCFLVVVLVFPYFVFAKSATVNPLTKLNNTGTAGGFSADTDEFTFSLILGLAVRAFISILGVIFIILMIYGGYTWMMARGNEEEAKKAGAIIRTAVIGLILVVGSYAIWNLISQALF